MAESVEDFLERGGKVTTVPEGQQTFKNIVEHRKHIERKKLNDDFTDHQMKKAENETDCRKPYYEPRR